MNCSDLLVSVVAPLRNEAEGLEGFVREVLALLQAQFPNFEVLLVDDGSTDATVAVAARLTQEHGPVRLIRLSRCFSPDIAAIAGLESSIGDFVIVLRPDSDPPAEIARMVQLAREGADVVQGISVDGPGQGLLFRFCRAGFYFISNRLLRLDMPPASSSLCGFSRRAVNAIVRVKQKQPHLGLLSCGVGFPRRTFSYHKVFRTSRSSRRSLWQALDQGIGLLVMHSTSPLRFISYLGGCAGLLNLLYGCYVVAVNCLKANVAEGWTTLSLQTSLMFFFVFLILVLMSEYISHILEEAKERPLYNVIDELGSSSVAPDAALRNVLGHSPPADNNQWAEGEGHRAA